MAVTLNRARRMEIDARLRCDHCGDAPYLVYRRQVMRRDGSLSPDVFEHVLWPNGSGVGPPLHPEHICCPHCGRPLRRVAG